MNFNEATIGYLLFYLTGALILVAFILLYIASKKKK
ncbi:MAG: hypothetical protein UV09_C0035G0019 [Candidatus Gottesmanbacteria bacterium GW2011_GWA2_42_18]|uniref:Uncharacterized protein n=1 Tax=Candidatus Gottesmanbacteria bacterium GW2011_GWA2_42_18 TaxID=1618442 RepID=A0A0G1C7D4_9BACT|nr:MAG: hypothetical protein UV09_C0035G0019 [Candidatus Gottesmanbacteria bacterium GW2011_GWA2_42_18]